MTGLLLLIRNLAPGLYILLAMGVVRGFLWLMTAQSELTWAQFPLERTQAERLGGRGISVMIVALQLMAVVWLTSNTMYDAWEAIDSGDQSEATNRDDQFATAIPISGAGSELQVPTQSVAGPGIIRTQPPSPTAAGTLRPADDPTGCIFDKAFINIPDNGQVIFQTESVIGTANIEDFGYYRFEIMNMDRGGAFGVIGGAESDYSNPVIDGPLGSIVPQNFEVGEHRFRLVVFDSSGNPRASCEITVFISEPLPTATPIGAGIPAPSGGIPAPAPTP